MVDRAALESAVRAEVARVSDMAATSVKSIRDAVAEALDVEPASLKSDKRFRSALDQALAQRKDSVDEGEAAASSGEEEGGGGDDDDERGGSESDAEERPRKKRKGAAGAPAKAVSKEMKLLRAFIAAARIGPAIYRRIPKEEGPERTKALAAAIREAGFDFAGDVPTPREISAQRKKREAEKELEGIDTSNIIEASGRRGRRAAAARASYREDDDDEEEEEEDKDGEEAEGSDEEEEQEKTNTTTTTKKKKKKEEKKKGGDEDDSDDDEEEEEAAASEGSGEEDDEEEESDEAYSEDDEDSD